MIIFCLLGTQQSPRPLSAPAVIHHGMLSMTRLVLLSLDIYLELPVKSQKAKKVTRAKNGFDLRGSSIFSSVELRGVLHGPRPRAFHTVCSGSCSASRNATAVELRVRGFALERIALQSHASSVKVSFDSDGSTSKPPRTNNLAFSWILDGLLSPHLCRGPAVWRQCLRIYHPINPPPFRLP